MSFVLVNKRASWRIEMLPLWKGNNGRVSSGPVFSAAVLRPRLLYRGKHPTHADDLSLRHRLSIAYPSAAFPVSNPRRNSRGKSCKAIS